MAKLKDKLWNWGHLEGSHNKCIGLDCSMTPEAFAEVYGIRNAFIVSYGGNIQPPFHAMAERLSVLREIKWSVLGDASTPLPDDELGNTKDILALPTDLSNITGGVVDDFFSPKRMERFPPEVLSKIKAALNAAGKDFWCVLYDMQLDMELEKYLDCFDGVTFWIWNCSDISNMEDYLEKLFTLTNGKPVMLGMYLWDYATEKKMDTNLFKQQLTRYTDLLQAGKIEGIIFCSSTIGDADLETNRILKQHIAEYGNLELER